MKISTIENTPPSERPRERLLSQGPRCLSLRECIAVILGSGPPGQGALGMAAAVLGRPGEGLSEGESERAFFTALEASAHAHLSGLAGLGDAGRSRVLAAFEIGRRYSDFRERNRTSTQFSRKELERKPLPERALAQVGENWRCDSREWLGFVPLFRNGTLGQLGIVELGTRTHVNTDPAELFARILALRPSGFFLFHNHPSGDLTPSQPDVDLTQKVSRVGSSLGTRLLGHAIVGRKGERWVII